MRRGEIWLINLDPSVGAEIRKTRPAVIVNDDAVGILPLKVIVPITEWKERYAVAPWLVRVEPDKDNGLDKVSAADAF
jgi:mRNA interferase MazF